MSTSKVFKEKLQAIKLKFHLEFLEPLYKPRRRAQERV